MPQDNGPVPGVEPTAGRGGIPGANPGHQPPPPAGAGDNAGGNNADNNNHARNNNNQNPLLNVRDRLFHALFFKAAIAYARAFPRPMRRFLEFIVLLKVCPYF